MICCFEKLSTVEFQRKMKPAAHEIYRKVFPNSRVVDLRVKGQKVHVLDQEFGIDSLIFLESGQWLSIQEKYRRNNALKYLEFTQEYRNADGTEYESDGEWFKLGAQLYFYGWANEEETGFEKWVILDVAKYKMLVEKAGGLKNMGELKHNRKHGRATFFAIPIEKLQPAFVADYKQYEH